MDAKTTGQKINFLDKGKFLNLGKVMPSGALEARKLSSGAVNLYWRFTLAGIAKREPIGIYDPSAPPKSLQPTAKGYSLVAAMRAAELLAAQHHANLEHGGFDDLKAQKAAAKVKANEEKREAEKYTLDALIHDYCDYLESLGRISHTEARNILRLHVIEPWPKLTAKPASQITGEQIADMMRHVVEQGKGRTANKLRSYLRSAYQIAKASRSKASIPLRFKSYRITHNPATDTEPDESANKADKRPLSTEELRAYWQAIKPLEGLRGAVLRLHLLTGGQRIQQLVRLQTADIHKDYITLLDGKGRPGKPARPHTIPLLPEAHAALMQCLPQGEFAISTDGGKSHLAGTTLSGWAADIAQAAGIENFQTKRIRSGVETLLASVRVSSDIRGRLQSHGISGVQARHYDGHDYLQEKQEALTLLLRQLEGQDATVHLIKAA
jgi:Site-specific recombinase XerD